MNIIWHGGSTIELAEKKTKAILNPQSKTNVGAYNVAVYDQTDDKLKAVDGKIMIDWPGEYDASGFMMRGIESHGEKKSSIIYTFHSKDGNVAWMGEMADYPSDEVIESLGEVHVLILPVGGKDVLTAKNSYRLVEALEPLIVIPVCFGDDREGLSAFLKEFDVKMPEVRKSYEFKKSALGGEEAMELVVLDG